MATMLQIRLPKPHPGQAKVITEARRFNVLCCGRRWGKTTFGIDRIVRPLLAGRPVAWFAPTYKNLADSWRLVQQVFRNVISRKLETEHRLELITGGSLEMWSLDKPDVARGRRYALAIVDEAAMVPNLSEAWQFAIRPTLVDFQGGAWFLSTPRGMNYFRSLWERGQDPEAAEWASWQMPTNSNPYMSASEIEQMRTEMHDRAFAQEVLAQFVSHEGAVFRGIMAAATVPMGGAPVAQHEYVIGLDWGRSLDYSVAAVLDATSRELVAMERWGEVDYSVQLNRLRALVEKWRPVAVVAESNSMGQPIIEQLYRDGLPVHPFMTTNASKALAVEGLALAFERLDLRIIPDPVLIGELQMFEAQRLPSGLMRYSAPDGQHDDTVMALAIAWSAVESYAPRAQTVVYEDRVRISPF
jgi:hypothetical protein